MLGFIFDTELHLTFLVTPVGEDVLSLVNSSVAMQWRKFMEVYKVVDKNPTMRKIAAYCGIGEGFSSRYGISSPSPGTAQAASVE